MSPRTRLRVLVVPLSALTFLASCGGNDPSLSTALAGPTAPTAVTGGTGVSTTAGAEKCYSVQFLATAPWGPTDLTFTLSGDLVGTYSTAFDPSTIKYSGPMPFFSGGTMSIEGEGTWQITGGNVPGLSNFQTTFTNRNLLSAVAGSPPDVVENIGSHRATTGVSKANLAYKGAASQASVEHRYHGVICP